MNLFHEAIVKKSHNCDRAKVKQWINKILIDASNDGGGSRKKNKERKTEAAVSRCSSKKVFLKILQFSPEHHR